MKLITCSFSHVVLECLQFTRFVCYQSGRYLGSTNGCPACICDPLVGPIVFDPRQFFTQCLDGDDPFWDGCTVKLPPDDCCRCCWACNREGFTVSGQGSGQVSSVEIPEDFWVETEKLSDSTSGGSMQTMVSSD